MFETLRRMIFPIIIIVLFFFVAMIVFQWGMGLSRPGQYTDANVAAVINGKEVSWETYNRVYQSLYQVESENTDEELPESKIREIQQTAWRQLLHDHLIMQEVAKHNLVVTDDELYAFLRYNPPPELQQLPYFQTDGRFDYQKYFISMTNPQDAAFWASVEPFVKENVLKQKLQEMIIQAAHVTEAEIKEYYLTLNEKIKVGMVNVGYDRFSNPPPKITDEDLEKFFNERRDDYPIDERAALNVALVEKKPQPLDWERTYNKAMAIYDSIQAGADFGEMADRYSEDPASAKDGGDLGWFPRGQMVEEFDRRVFSMKESEISEPIRSKFGWHIIKLHAFKEEMEKPRGEKEKESVQKAHASHILVKTEAGQETLDQAYRRLEEFHTAAKKKGFFKAAEDLSFPIKKTALFFRDKNIQFIGRDTNAGKFAFENEVDAISDILENKTAFFVVQVAERVPAGMATFEEARKRVNLDILKYKVATLCRDTADAIFAEIQKGTDIEKAAKMFGEEYETPAEFSHTGYVKGLSHDPMAIGAAFSLSEPGQVSKPIDFDQGTVIFKLLERTSPDLSDYNARRDSLYAVILNYKHKELYGRWFETLIENSDIVNNTEKAFQESGEF
jgi:peptidyl-prolyl cis-trans isomerase D